MSAKPKKYNPLPESRGWQLEFAHLFVFPADRAVELPQRWWLEITSEQSEDFVSTRSKNMLEERGMSQAEFVSGQRSEPRPGRKWSQSLRGIVPDVSM